MTVLLDNTPLIPAQRPKARLLNCLVRHASAPARPHRTPECHGPRESGQEMGVQRSLPSPTHTPNSPRSKPSLLRELSLMQSLVSRFRLERVEFCNTTQIQERQLLSNERELERQKREIVIMEDENAALATRHEEDVSASNRLIALFQGAVAKHDLLVDQLNDAMRTTARLKKSDRAKGKVWQRNLRLKTTLQRFQSHSSSSSAAADTSTEDALQEALAMAEERIEELESRGEALLEALEKQNYSCGSDQDEAEDDALGFGLVEAEVAFRGVLEDETFREQKEHRAYLLQE